MEITCSIIVTTRPHDEVVRLLGREATQLKKTDINAAAACLERAQQLMRAHRDGSQTLDWWMRLPKYLKQAGRSAEARATCQQLLDEVDARWEWSGGDRSGGKHVRAEKAALENLLKSL